MCGVSVESSSRNLDVFSSTFDSAVDSGGHLTWLHRGTTVLYTCVGFHFLS